MLVDIDSPQLGHKALNIDVVTMLARMKGTPLVTTSPAFFDDAVRVIKAPSGLAAIENYGWKVDGDSEAWRQSTYTPLFTHTYKDDNIDITITFLGSKS